MSVPKPKIKFEYREEYTFVLEEVRSLTIPDLVRKHLM